VTSSAPGPGRGRRVVSSHRLTTAALRLAAAYGGVAITWGFVVAIRGGSWWGPLHAFLAGTVLLAISGATQLFTVTWAAAVPPTAGVTAFQRWAIALGVAGILVGVPTRTAVLVVAGASLLVVGIVLLAYSLVGAIRRSLLRRFDLSARFYLLALGCGTVGVGLGAVLATGRAGTGLLAIRTAHLHLNLVGLVGFTVVGTLPTFLPTLARHRAVGGLEAVLAWWTALLAPVAFLAGILLGPWAVGVGALLAAGAAGTVLGGILLRLERRPATLPFLHVVAGVGWLVAWTVQDGVRLLGGSFPPPFPSWTAAVAIGGVAQVLLGALAYLVPVLLGPGPNLGPNLRRMGRRRPLALLLANGAAVAALAGAPFLVTAAVGGWAIDFAARLLTLRPPSR